MNFGDLIDENDTRKSCNTLLNDGLIELSDREYMLTARFYEKVKNDVDYTRDKAIQYLKAKGMITEYIKSFLSNSSALRSRSASKIVSFCLSNAVFIFRSFG